MILKLFKKTAGEYEFQQRVSLTVQEKENLIEKSGDIRSWFTEEESTEPTSSKKNSTKVRRNLHDKTLSRKMVEAMYQRSPNYSNQVQNRLNFKIVEE